MGVTIVGRGTATPPQVLATVPFSSDTGTNQTGTMPNEGAVVLTPSGTGTVPIPAGYHNGSGYIAEVTVPAADVLTGTTIAGVAGTMPENGALGTYTPTTTAQSIPAGHTSGGSVAGDANLVAANIAYGVSIFGVAGSLAATVKYVQGTVTANIGNVTWYMTNSGTLNGWSSITIPIPSGAEAVFGVIISCQTTGETGSFFAEPLTQSYPLYGQTVMAYPATANGSATYYQWSSGGAWAFSPSGITIPAYMPGNAYYYTLLYA